PRDERPHRRGSGNGGEGRGAAPGGGGTRDARPAAPADVGARDPERARSRGADRHPGGERSGSASARGRRARARPLRGARERGTPRGRHGRGFVAHGRRRGATLRESSHSDALDARHRLHAGVRDRDRNRGRVDLGERCRPGARVRSHGDSDGPGARLGARPVESRLADHGAGRAHAASERGAMTRRARFWVTLGVLFGLGGACKTEYNAPVGSRPNNPGSGGAATGSMGGSAGFTPLPGSGGASTTGGRPPDEPPTEDVLTFLNGAVDAEALLVCLGHRAEGTFEPVGEPFPEGGLAYGRALVVEPPAELD